MFFHSIPAMSFNGLRNRAGIIFDHVQPQTHQRRIEKLVPIQLTHIEGEQLFIGHFQFIMQIFHIIRVEIELIRTKILHYRAEFMDFSIDFQHSKNDRKQREEGRIKKKSNRKRARECLRVFTLVFCLRSSSKDP